MIGDILITPPDNMPHDDGYFDERVAARYDESSAEMFDPAVIDPAVDYLARLAGDGRALEFGIGTGDGWRYHSQRAGCL